MHVYITNVALDQHAYPGNHSPEDDDLTPAERKQVGDALIKEVKLKLPEFQKCVADLASAKTEQEKSDAIVSCYI